MIPVKAALKDQAPLITYQKLDSNDITVYDEEKKLNGVDMKNPQAVSDQAASKDNGLVKMMSAQSAPTPTDTVESPAPKRRMSRADRAAAKAAQ